MRPLLRALACLVPLALAAPAAAGPLDELTLDVEAGPLYFLQNDGRYGAAGSFYTAETVAQNRNLFIARRASGEARFLDRHTVVLLYAPLDVDTTVTLGAPLTFRDVTFPAGSVVTHRYLFDGLRASYLYRLYQGYGLTGELGGTLQIRNAQVAFTDEAGTRFVAERDIGLVPALKARLRYDTPNGLYAMWEADGLASPVFGGVKGSILDTALTLGLPVRSDADVFVRLRYLAGGAEVPNREINNWGQFVVASGGIRWKLGNPAPKAE
ncbi:hypothetical protein D3C72_678500 [compost metagenome]